MKHKCFLQRDFSSKELVVTHLLVYHCFLRLTSVNGMIMHLVAKYLGVIFESSSSYRLYVTRYLVLPRACLVSQLCPTLCDLRTVALQAPQFMGFTRQEYWRGLPCPPPGDLPDPRIEHTSPVSPALQGNSLPTEPSGKPSSATFTSRSYSPFLSPQSPLWSKLLMHLA